jgi:hypothetical protein
MGKGTILLHVETKDGLHAWIKKNKFLQLLYNFWSFRS